MNRRASTMKQTSDAAEEYIRHHDSFPTVSLELIDDIRANGVAPIIAIAFVGVVITALN